MRSRGVRRWPCFLLMNAIHLSLMFAVQASDGESIFFHDNYQDALQEAKLSGKPIFLEFRCAP